MAALATQKSLLESTPTPKINVTITALFFDRSALQRAVRSVNVSDSGAAATITRAWCRIMMEAGQSAEIGRTKMRLACVVTLDADIFNTAGFTALVNMGMIIATSDDVESEVGDEHFEKFWTGYPKRNNQRVGKAEARAEFNRNIKTIVQFEQLIIARDRYAETCGGYPKDASRFIKGNRWMEYLPTNPDTAGGTAVALPTVTTTPRALSGAQLREMLEQQ
jgi:hypothetical protein